jgi:ABC transporter DrrB family efflux protein
VASPLLELTRTKIRGILREPEFLFWVFLFPVLLALALGLAFRTADDRPVPVGVLSGEGAETLHVALAADPALDVRTVDENAARAALRRGRVDLVIVPGDPVVYWLDPTRPESRLARRIADDAVQSAAGRTNPRAVATREVDERGSRYIDFLLPGLLGMNLMGTGMWGIGFTVVNQRSRGILKRFVATPMRRRDYLLAQVLGRLVFLVLEVAVLVGFGRLAFGVPVRGTVVALIVVSLSGAAAFAGLGLLIASRARTVEGLSGLANFVMLPMWILSGIFFSTERFPDAMQPVVQILPLTALIDALRDVMLEGATLAGVGSDLGVMAVWGLVAFGVALWGFRWR